MENKASKQKGHTFKWARGRMIGECKLSYIYLIFQNFNRSVHYFYEKQYAFKKKKIIDSWVLKTRAGREPGDKSHLLVLRLKSLGHCYGRYQVSNS